MIRSCPTMFPNQGSLLAIEEELGKLSEDGESTPQNTNPIKVEIVLPVNSSSTKMYDVVEPTETVRDAKAKFVQAAIQMKRGHGGPDSYVISLVSYSKIEGPLFLTEAEGDLILSQLLAENDPDGSKGVPKLELVPRST